MTKIKIVIVEDEAIVAEDIKYMLKSLNYDAVAMASTGKEALEKVEETKPNLVLMDIMLKGDMDGVEVAREIQKKHGIPVVYLTAYADNETLQRAKTTIPYGYIIKPFDKKELYTAIEIAMYKFSMERNLKENEKKYRTLFEDSGDAMYIADKSGIFIDVNQSALDLFGYTREEMLNMKVENIYLEEKDRTDVLQRLLLYGQVRNFEIYLKKKDGSVITGLITLTAIYDENEEIVNYQGIIKDITERKQKEDALKKKAKNINKRFKELKCLYSISNLVEQQNELGNIIQGTISLIPSALQYPEIAGALISVEGTTYQTDNFKETEWKEARDISIRGNKIGTFEVHYYENRNQKNHKPFLKQEQILFSVIAERLGKIIEQMRVENELKQSLDKLEAVTEGVVQAMAITTELRDPYTAGHQRRVSRLAVEIAKKMNLPQNKIDGIKVGGLIHDIGKISVPAEILSKPGKLSEIELSIIKTHSQVGYEILKNIEFPWPIAQMVLQHHEKINGSGYPKGIDGEKILLEAKIISVADVVEAMASHRPYRPALGIEEALNEVETHKHILYDEDIVEICVSLFRKEGFKIDE